MRSKKPDISFRVGGLLHRTGDDGSPSIFCTGEDTHTISLPGGKIKNPSVIESARQIVTENIRTIEELVESHGAGGSTQFKDHPIFNNLLYAGLLAELYEELGVLPRASVATAIKRNTNYRELHESQKQFWLKGLNTPRLEKLERGKNVMWGCPEGHSLYFEGKQGGGFFVMAIAYIPIKGGKGQLSRAINTHLIDPRQKSELKYASWENIYRLYDQDSLGKLLPTSLQIGEGVRRNIKPGLAFAAHQTAIRHSQRTKGPKRGTRQRAAIEEGFTATG
jgi:hypothetical protein